MKERQKPNLKTRILGSAVLAGAVGLAALGGYEVYNNIQNTPEPSPIAQGSNSPTPKTPEVSIFPSPEITPTPTPEITLSPTPEPSPTPDMTKWWNQIPESTVPIEKVPLISDGTWKMFGMSTSPYYAIEIINPTVVAIETDQKNDILRFGITQKGDKITKSNCIPTNMNGHDLPLYTTCQYSGATLWFEVNNNVSIIKFASNEERQKGPAALAPYIKVGDTIRIVEFEFEKNGIYTPEQLLTNTNSFKKLASSLGKHYPRSDKRFFFYPGVLTVTVN